MSPKAKIDLSSGLIRYYSAAEREATGALVPGQVAAKGLVILQNRGPLKA